MRENYLLHKLHSLSGIIPVGFYMVQHLTLNSFSLASPEAFNGVVEFFTKIPPHALLLIEAVLIWIPLLFHAVYGVFIASRAQYNSGMPAYRFTENRYFTLQRMSGVLAFAFLAWHVVSTTGKVKISGSDEHILYFGWQEALTANGYVLLVVYLVGILACTYHLSYGVWNFCIRWGITVNERAQRSVAKFASAMFVVLTLLGYAALFGFLIHDRVPVQAKTVPSHYSVR